MQALADDEATTGTLYRLDGVEVETRGDSLKLQLAPNETAVWYLDRKTRVDYSKTRTETIQGQTVSSSGDRELF